MKLQKIILACMLVILAACGGSDGGGDSIDTSTPEPVDIVPGALNVASVIPENNQICSFSRFAGNQAEIDFSFAPITNADRYEVRVNNQMVYAGRDTRFSAVVDFSTQGTWRISAISIDDVVTLQPELSFTVPAAPSVNQSPQPVDYLTIRYDRDAQVLSWDPVTDPDGDPIEYSFMILVNQKQELNFPGLENPTSDTSVAVVLEKNVNYEIIIIAGDGTFRRFSSSFYYHI